MKTKLLSGFAVVLLIVLMAAAGCVKYEKSTPFVINDSISATIHGTAYADLDLSDGDMETAPSGTKIYIKVALDEYNPNAPAGQFKVYTTTVGSDGTYTISIPSNNNGIDFTVIPEDFQAEQTQWDGSTVETTTFYGQETYGNVIADESTYINVYYND